MADEPQLNSKILVVDDDPNVVDLVRLYLERDGHEVLIANDGVAGLETAREELPDLIVLDLMMPRMDGMELCRTLRVESSVPVVMLTAMVEEDDRFFRADPARARATGGVGLGPTIAKQLVEVHGGTIHVESIVPTGARFVFELPVAPPYNPA